MPALAAAPTVTIRERLYVGLGLAALGDGSTALAIERDLLSTLGERRGPGSRRRVGAALGGTVEATSLLALLAAELGDPLANDAEGYVDANPAVDELHSLQQVAFITRMLAPPPPGAAPGGGPARGPGRAGQRGGGGGGAGCWWRGRQPGSCYNPPPPRAPCHD